LPFKLHPSGYLSQFTEQDEQSNLQIGKVCPVCKKLCGHDPTCPHFTGSKGGSSRAKLFNASSVLWAMCPEKSFITFTLPSLPGRGYYQDNAKQDIAIGQAFSRTLEAFSIRLKRSGKKLSYVWVAESQTKRKNKYGGIGDLHYHLIANVRIKSDPNKYFPRGQVIDQNTLDWLQDNWTNQIGVSSSNCVDVEPIPDYVNSMPSYLSKYLGKGAQRFIHSRQFGCTRDLSKFQPIILHELPEVDLMSESVYKTSQGFEVVSRYYHTQQVLEQYGSIMAVRQPVKVDHDPNFHHSAITDRATKRHERVLAELYPSVYPSR
jgi:hypothetical protein